MQEFYQAKEAYDVKISDGKLPSEIQWMPPGRHTIQASKNGKPARVTVEVNADTAAAIAASFAAMTKAGRRPYLDFNHASGPASARVKAVRWGGDDPISGGVRIETDWTSAGISSLQGGEYFSFSPNFLLHEKTGRVAGTTVNMGGLVNEPAFTSISPVAAKENTDTMTKLITALVAAKLIASVELSDDEAAAQFSAAFAPFKEAKDTLPTIQAKLSTLEQDVIKAKESRAEALVQAAINEGRLPAKDEASKGFWKTSIVQAGATAEAALAALPVNPVLAEVVKMEAKQTSPDANDVAKQQNDAVAAYQAKHSGASFSEAWGICAQENPKLFS
jgi:hypothetical protein